MTRLPNRRFIVRDLREEDVLECLAFNPSHIGQEIVGLEAAIAVWKSLIRNCASVSTVLEVDPPHAGCRIAGFAARVFVSQDFAESETANPRPGLNARLIASMAKGPSVALSESEIRHANSQCGLDMVILGGWRPGMLDAESAGEAYACLASYFFEMHAGYWVNRLMSEITNEMDRRLRAAAGVWAIRDFETPGRALATITRDNAFLMTGHGVAALFQRRKPELRLRGADQRFLQAALDGLTDEELSLELTISLTSVKKRWLSLFERVSDTHPRFFPGAAAEQDRRTRGRQKRHVLLAHLRSHPEELRPYEW